MSHNNVMFESLYTLYCEGNNCDLYVLSEDDDKFFVHSCVVAASIPKIREIIVSSLQETFFNSPLKLSGVFSRELKLIIRFAYLHKCDIGENPQHILTLLKAATYLGVTEIKSLCEEVLLKALDMITSVDLLRSDLGDNVLLHEMSVFFLLRNLTSQPCLETCNLSAKCILSLLSDERLHAPYEEQAVVVALQWVQHNPTQRKTLLPHLLRALRLSQLSQKNFNMLKGHPLVASNQHAILVLEMAKISILHYEYLKSSTSETLPLTLCPRLPHAVIVCLGGWTKNGPCDIVECYDHIAERWTNVPSLSLPGNRVYFGLEQLGDFLYILGGYGDTHYLNTCARLSLLTFRWNYVTAMTERRTFVSSGVLNGEIYAISGRLEDQRLHTAEKYNPSTNSWTALPNLTLKRSDAGTAVLNGMLYVVGGFDGVTVHNSVEIFDPAINMWTLGAPLNTARGGLRCVAMNGCIYAIGGSNGVERLNSVERFDPIMNAWSTVTPMIKKRSNFGVTVLDNRIFVLGGYSNLKLINKCEVYDSIADCWYTIPSMPTERSALSCCVIDDLNFSEWVWSAGAYNQSVPLRNPNHQRPQYYPTEQWLLEMESWSDKQTMTKTEDLMF